MSNFAGGNSSSENTQNGDPLVGQSGYLSSGQGSFGIYEVSLDAIPVSNDSSDAFLSSISAFRVLYDPDSDPYSPYTAFRCFITTIEGTRFFIGAFDTDTGDVVPVIQIQFIGQTIESLVERLNAIPGLSAQSLNDWGFSSVNQLVDSGHLNATNTWGYFFVTSTSVKSSRESSLPLFLRFYFTSVEPGLEQTNPSQSIGGYVSPTKIYESTVLSAPLSFYFQYFKVEDDSLQDFSLVQINDEIIEIEKWDGNTAYVKYRQSFGTPIRYHHKGSEVKGISKNDLFDKKLNKDLKQYRCIALKNTSEIGEIARDVLVFFKLASRNSLSRTRLAIEIPKAELYSGSASDGTRSSFKDVSLAGTWENDHFTTCYLSFTSGSNDGQSRIISKYIGATGEIILESDFPNTIKNGDEYTIDVSPSQRLRTGFESPITGEEAKSIGRNVSDFQNATFFSNGLSININDYRTNGVDLHPNEVVYIWIEREIDDINEGFYNNRSVLTINYNRV